MTSSSRTIRCRFAAVLLPVMVAFMLGACKEKPPATHFSSVDISTLPYGKNFALTDHQGVRRTLADYRGKVVALSFGFMHCPDTCPMTMMKMSNVMKKLGPDSDRIQVIFITLDPERDSPELLAQYVTAFDPRFVGLRGTREETDYTAKLFKVFHQKVEGDGPDNYTIDHTAGSYVFDPRGQLRLFMRHAQSEEPIARDLKLLLAGN